MWQAHLKIKCYSFFLFKHIFIGEKENVMGESIPTLNNYTHQPLNINSNAIWTAGAS